MTSSVKSLKTTPLEWKTRLADVPVSKDQINALVADYLFTEGYTEAATNFSREAGLAGSFEFKSIEHRQNIRRSVLNGNILEAIRLVNDIDPELLDRDQSLNFRLQKQHLIELIREGRIPEALMFAQTELAPRGEANPEFLRELEEAMALLAFEMPSLGSTYTKPEADSNSKKKVSVMPRSISCQLDPARRIRVAEELNEKLLTSLSFEPHAKLPGLLRILAWSETVLTERGADIPRWHYEEILGVDQSTM